MKVDMVDIRALHLARRGDKIVLSMERKGMGWLRVTEIGPDASSDLISLTGLIRSLPDEQLEKEIHSR